MTERTSDGWPLPARGPVATAPAAPAHSRGAQAPSTDTVADWCARLTDNVGRVIQGKRDVIELALVCLVAGGHLLIEDVPGVGKTMLARCLAASIDGKLQRIQFTPDLLPSDITGVTIYNQQAGNFQFHPGPVFGNIVHGDEINRASPKTQAALLEVMEEGRVTVDGTPYSVPRPFMVIATQNPVDMDGTYPLPEAQLDRFLMQLSVGYPDHAAEVSVLVGGYEATAVDSLPAVTSAREVSAIVEQARRVHVAQPMFDYMVRVTAATRTASGVRLGASPRAGLALLRAVRARAAAAGRNYAVPDDVKHLAVPILAHRLLLTPDAELAGRTATDVVNEALATVPVPQPRAGA
jgi:MoxR-like ATPase